MISPSSSVERYDDSECKEISLGQSLQKNCIDGVSISFYYFQSLVYSNYSMEISNIELTTQRGEVQILRDKARVLNQSDDSIKHYQKTFRFS